MIAVGPRRLILIGSADYAYAEIDLDRPIHIVGGNNVGKTSIVNALQFLYVDDARYMHFGENEPGVTRRHYFGGNPGLILFECQTPRRRMVIGVRGLGPAEGYKYERFCYEGDYSRDTFIDDQGVPRPWEQVSSNLGTFRNYRKLSPKELRQALTGGGAGPDLGLVPLRQSIDFDVFRERFVDILRLTQIKGDDLKRSIIEICRGEGTFQDRIDLLGTYNESYQLARRSRVDAEQLQKLIPDMAVLRDAINHHRETLPHVVREWRSIASSQVKLLARAVTDLERTREESLDLSRQMLEADAHVNKADHSRILATAERTTVANKLTDLDERETRFGSVDEEALANEEKNASRRVFDLEIALNAAAANTVVNAMGRLRKAEGEVVRIESQIKVLDRPIMLDWLMANGFSGGEIQILSGIIQPELLGLEQNVGVVIHDDKQLSTHLRSILSQVDSGHFLAPAVSIDLSHITAAPIERADRQELEASLKRARDEVAGAQTALDAAQNREKVEADYREAKTLQKRLATTLHEVRRLHEERASRAELEARLAKADQDQKAAAMEYGSATAHRASLSEQGRVLRDLGQKITEERNWLQVALRSATPTEDDRVDGDRGDISLDALAGRLRSYHQQRQDIEAQRSSIARGHADLSRHLNLLPAEHDAMLIALETAEEEATDKIRIANETWRTLLGSLTTSVRQLKESYASIERRVDDLNRQLVGVTVSDIERIRFRAELRRTDMDMLDAFLGTRASDDDMFLDRAAQEDADVRIAAMIQRGVLKVADMFTLGVEVTRRSKAVTYAGIDRIESNGTGITIKIVVGLLLLRSVLKIANQRIPYYIDEANALDDRNLQSIIDFGLKRGFVPILASPQPSSCADVFYFPERDGNTTWILPERHRIERVTTPVSQGASEDLDREPLMDAAE